MTPEIREIPGFPGYGASADGSIWSCRPANRNGGPRPWRALSLSLCANYLYVGVRKNGRDGNVRAHRLVFAAFNGPIPAGMFINHLDGDKTNNAISNLEATTPSGNCRHALSTGLCEGRARGERSNLSTLTSIQVAQIRSLSGFSTQQAIADFFGISQSNVSRILNSKTWASIEEQNV